MILMKTKTIILASMAWLMAACAEDVERPAQDYLNRAQAAYSSKQYHTAKLQIDSIKMMHPKAFETRKQAQALLLQVELAESMDNKAYTDSLLQDLRHRIAPLTEKLYLDKDTRYQETGNYYAASHRIEKHIGRSYLRPQVDERGRHSITVFNRGKAIAAHLLRFTADDGTFVEVAATEQPYVTSDATGRTERVDFVPNPIGAVGSFVKLHGNKKIKVELIGDKGKATIPFANNDAAAMTDVYELATLLTAIGELEKQQQELERRIEFFTKRIQADSSTPNTSEP